MPDLSHLHAIQDRLTRERARLAAATTDNERAFRQVQVNGAEREEAAEYKFLGITPVTLDDILSDDELLRELQA